MKDIADSEINHTLSSPQAKPRSGVVQAGTRHKKARRECAAHIALGPRSAFGGFAASLDGDDSGWVFFRFGYNRLYMIFIDERIAMLESP